MPTFQKVMGPEIPSSQKGHGARDTLPQKKDMGPRIRTGPGTKDTLTLWTE